MHRDGDEIDRAARRVRSEPIVEIARDGGGVDLVVESGTNVEGSCAGAAHKSTCSCATELGRRRDGIPGVGQRHPRFLCQQGTRSGLCQRDRTARAEVGPANLHTDRHVALDLAANQPDRLVDSSLALRAQCRSGIAVHGSARRSVAPLRNPAAITGVVEHDFDGHAFGHRVAERRGDRRGRRGRGEINDRNVPAARAYGKLVGAADDQLLARLDGRRPVLRGIEQLVGRRQLAADEVRKSAGTVEQDIDVTCARTAGELQGQSLRRSRDVDEEIVGEGSAGQRKGSRLAADQRDGGCGVERSAGTYGQQRQREPMDTGHVTAPAAAACRRRARHRRSAEHRTSPQHRWSRRCHPRGRARAFP